MNTITILALALAVQIISLTMVSDSYSENDVIVNVNTIDKKKHKHGKKKNTAQYDSESKEEALPSEIPVYNNDHTSDTQSWSERKALKNAGEKVVESVVNNAADQIADRINNSVTAAIQGRSVTNDPNSNFPEVKSKTQQGDAFGFRCNNCGYQSSLFLKVKGKKNLIKCPKCDSTQPIN